MTAPARTLLSTFCAFLLAASLVPAAALADEAEPTASTEAAAANPTPDGEDAPAADAAPTATEGEPQGAPAEELPASEDAAEAPAASADEGPDAIELGTVEGLTTLQTTVPEEQSSPLSSFFSMLSGRSTVEVKLASGSHERWIDRIDKAGHEYIVPFYQSLVEASDGDGTADYLIDDQYLSTKAEVNPMAKVSESSEVGDGVFIPSKDAPSAYFPCILAAKVPVSTGYPDALVQAYVTEAYGAFDRDNPQAFWRNRQFAVTDAVTTIGDYRYYGFILTAGVKNDDGSTRVWTPRAAEYSSAKSIKDAINLYHTRLDIITDGMTAEDKATEYSKVKYFNQWLVDHNSYNSNNLDALERADSMYPWSALSALTGIDDANDKRAPVCEGYARAMQALCQEEGVPCVLTDGDVGGGGASTPHMWNYTRVEGAWYGVDVTWNHKNNPEHYLLKGGKAFLDSHPATNRFVATGSSGYQGQSFTNGPQLSDSDYVYDANKEEPTLTLPKNLKATYGSTLSSVSIPTASGDTPGTWSWSSPNNPVGDVGTNAHAAIFTPQDTSTYRVVTRDLSVQVTAKDATPTVKVEGAPFSYTGKPITPALSVSVDGVLLPSTSYEAEYADNVAVGTATVTVSSITGNYSFSDVEATFEIVKARDWLRFAESLEDGAEVTVGETLALSASGVEEAEITFSIESGSDIARLVTATGITHLRPTAAGTITVKASAPAGESYEADSATCEVTAVAPEFTAPEGLVTLPVVDDNYRVAAMSNLADKSIQKLTDAKTDLTTKQAIALELMRGATSVMAKARADQTAVYDFTLFGLDEDGEWVEMDGDSFPEEGIEVRMGFPKKGMAPETHAFAVVHMFTDKGNGFKPGQMETPEVTIDKTGLSFKLMGCSPVTVSWLDGDEAITHKAGLSSSSAAGTGTTGKLAQTGDSLPIVPIVVVILIVAVALVGVVAYQRRRKGQDDEPGLDQQ